MKKRILALISAIAMILPMAFATVVSAASTPTIEVVYDEAASSATTAVVKVYAKGFGDYDAIGMLAVQVNYDPTVIDEATAYTNRKTILSTQSDLDGATLGVNKSRDTITFSKSSADRDLSWDESEPILVANLPLLADKANKEFDFAYNETYSTIKVTEADTNIKSDVVSIPGTYKPISAGGDDEDVVTTYFSTESAVQTGKIPYWYATIGGVNKKKAATWEANVEGGSAKFGLIFTGSETISDMSIAWE